MAEAEVGLKASLKDRVQTARGLREIDQGVDKVGRSAQLAGTRARLASGGFDAMRRSGRLAAAGIKIGFAAALTAGYGAVRLLRSAFDEAREAQKVGALTRQTLKSMGKDATTTARHVEGLSGRLSDVAGIDDEIIQGGANVVIRFKNIRNELGKGNKIFDRAIRDSTDFAAALAGDNSTANVAGAAQKVGRLLADPIKGMGLLARSGLVFTDQQKDQVKAMVEGNDLLGAQKFLLDQLEQKFGGAAKSQATWGEKADVMWKNMEERLGTALLPLLDDTEKWFVKKGGPALDHYVGIFEDKGVPAIRHFADEAKPVANRLLPKIGDVLGTVRDVLADAAPYAEDLLNAFTGMPSWARKALVGGGLAAYVGSKTGVTGALSSLLGSKSSGGLLGAISKAKPLPVYVVNNGLGLPGETGGAGLAGGAAAGVGARGAGVKLPGFIPLVPVGLGSAPDQQSLLDTVRGKTDPNAISKSDLMSEDEFRAWAANRFNVIDAIKDAAQTARVETLLFGKDLEKTGRTPVAPPFSTPGLPESQRAMDIYKGALVDVGKPVNTKVNLDTGDAIAAAHRFADQALALFGIGSLSGGGAGPAATPSPTASPASPPTHPVPDPPTRHPVERLAIENRLYIDGREVTVAVERQVKKELANR